MEITINKITHYENGHTKGFASITIDDAFVVTGITIVEGSNGRFISFPQRKDNKGEWHDICFPNSKDIRDIITEIILDEFDKSEEGEEPEKDEEVEKPAAKKVVKK